MRDEPIALLMALAVIERTAEEHVGPDAAEAVGRRRLGDDPLQQPRVRDRVHWASLLELPATRRWWAARDLNPRPSRCKRDALPLS